MNPIKSDMQPILVALPDPAGNIEPDWLRSVTELFGVQAAVPAGFVAPAPTVQLEASRHDRHACLSEALELAGTGGVLLLTSGLELPTGFDKRLAGLAADSDCPPLTLFAGNHDSRLNPAAGLEGELDAATCDALANLVGRPAWSAVDCSHPNAAWLDGRQADAALDALERGLGWLFDGLFVHDPRQPLNHGELASPDINHALGPLRLALTGLLETEGGLPALPTPGIDARPVNLHISHDWGGGVARWISDFIEADSDAHHLVLAASGESSGHVHGQSLRLYAAGPGRGLVQEWVLTPAIAATVDSHRQYAELLTSIIRRYGIGRILVSSLIGHSIEALKTGLPTIQVLHDFYPAWPVLDADPLHYLDDQAVGLERALGEHRAGFHFEDHRAETWHALARAWQETIEQHEVSLVAPTRQVAMRWDRLCPGIEKRIGIIGHGFAPWKQQLPEWQPRLHRDGRLNLVVVGRLNPGKGLRLLEKALPRLCPHARITLLGAGQHGMRLFGKAGVDIVLDYEQARLPQLIATLAPQGALFLSTVAETWNYVLSETRALGLVPIATRTGSFIERIEDGIDGILFDPDADSLVEVISELAARPEQLSELIARLPTETSCKAMVAAYNHRLAPCSPVRMTARLNTPGFDAAHQLHATLADTTLENHELHRRIDTLEEELSERTAWARRYERLAQERTRWAQQLDQRLEKERAETRATIEQALHEAKEAREEVEQAREEIRLARKLDEEYSGWIQAMRDEIAFERSRNAELKTEMDALLSSRSWRMTRPWRVAGRVLLNIRLHQAWNPIRWPVLTAQFFSNIRLIGLRAALHRLHHVHSAPAPAPTAVLPQDEPALPAADPSPVHLEPADSHPQASIIIPVYNKIDYTAACLLSIAEHTPAGQYEVIVVDDCSTDNTADFLKKCRGIKVLRNESNSGFIHSCNAGAQIASGEYLILLNNDTTVTAGWFESLLDTFLTYPDAGAVGARLVYPDGRLQEAGGIIFRDGSGWNYGRNDNPNKPQYNFVSETDYVSGACLAVPRREFLELGGFDTRYVPAYYEDTDLCFQVRAQGKQVIYQPAATIIHHEGVSSGVDESSGTKRYQAINRDKFLEKWSETLSGHPEATPDHEREDPVRHLRFRRTPRHVLIIDAVTPQPDHDSGSVRITAMLTLLREMGCQVSFMPENLAWAGTYSEALQQAGIEVLCAPMVTSLESWLKEHGRDLDMVIGSRHYVLAPMLRDIRRHCPQAQLIFDTVDLHFLREEREAEVTGSADIAAQAALTRSRELKLIAEADVTLVVSSAEKELLAELAPGSDVRIVSNIHQTRESSKGWAERSDLMIVGGFQHVPNVDAARWLVEEIFPLVRSRIPDIVLHLIGSRMPPEIGNISAPGVKVHGFVADLDPYLEGCRLSVAPLRYGAGVKGKVNQAMACGLPVVATSCAAEGMFLEHGLDVMIGDDAASLAECIVQAYTDEALWHKLSENGRANVERHFSRQAAGRELQRLLGISASDDAPSG